MKKIIIGVIVIFILVIIFFIVRFSGDQVCNKYGDKPSMRANTCNSNAPWFCKNKHFPPSQEGYQDSIGCGFVF